MIRLFINLSMLLLGFMATVCAQQQTDFSDLDQQLALDPSVVTGTLDNGLTYYIKNNTRPEHKAELRLVINAGSILEDEDQLGLAHFVEHMAFNGTTSFKKNELIDYLQSIGVQFGADLNAHTSFDETVYKLTVPTDDDDIFNTSLQILKEWAGGITFSDEEIDNERGVVAEELRARSGAGSRMYDQSIPVITNNARYADRLPIGSLDVIINSDYDAMKRFYRDWYRPDLMALVLVGDFDAEDIEMKVNQLFKDLKPTEEPKERTVYQIKTAQKPAAKIITDKETQKTSVAIYYKKEHDNTISFEDYRTSMLEKLYSGMLRARLEEIAQSKDTPFLAGAAGIGFFLGNKDSYFLRANLKEGKALEGYKALLKESERARRFGFTQTELDRYKDEMIQNAELFKTESDKIPHRIYVEALIDNFTFEDPVVSEDFRFNFYKETLPEITLEDVNTIAENWVNTTDIAVILTAPENDSEQLPTETTLLSELSEVKNLELKPYVDDMANVALMENKPEPGELVKESYNEKVDATTWEFANGVTVIVKPTTFQNDMIKMSGFREGGSSIAPDSIYVSARESGRIISESGINSISNVQLTKLNMGKNISVTPYINYYEELISGSSNRENLERMFQMTHLYFTAPNKDQNSFQSHKENLIELYKGNDDSPGSYFEKIIAKTMMNNHLRAIPLEADQIESDLKIDEVFNFYKERFSNANGFTFVLAGNFEPKHIKELATIYLASLPADLKENSTWKDIGLRRVTGNVKKVVKKGIENKADVDMRYTGKLNYSPETAEELNLLAKVLKIRLTEELREKMGGVYGVRVSGFTTDRPYEWYRMQVRFTCDPNNIEALKNKVFEEIEDIKRNGVSDKNLNKIKEAELSRTEEFLKYDAFWISKIKEAYTLGRDYGSFLDYKEKIAAIDSDYFKEAAQHYFDNTNYAEFILLPED
ncbi:M16 family metallopeptidase [Leeuwenhoekiella aestuarii]|uniref:Zinc protease n=1 Tax=Leeuwenhoekiella aestuarii TaxID=2249426 RepID=A0A4Q0NWS9_9FLAO|nr:insulinase family protein [Leeuwenhoekiella aestuarii]RXG16656.1 zinc protease [Leeuwenhoekiella aestuarii]